MTRYKNIFNKIYTLLAGVGRAIWKGLSFSLADPLFSFAKVVCISMEADGVYLVYAGKVLWRKNIRHFKYYPLPENQMCSPEYVALSVAAFVKDFKISNATFVLGLPRSWAIIQNVDFPLAAKENLSRVIAFELDRLTPLSRDNACYDFTVLGEDAQNVKILLAVVRADQINGYLEALKARSIEVKRISLGVFMIRPVIQSTYPNTNAVFISLKNGAYEGGVIVNTFTTRSFAGRVDANDQDAVAGFLKQIHECMDDLTTNSRPPRIVVNADENGYKEMKDRFTTVTVSHLNKDLKLKMPKQNGDLSAVALGGVLESLGGQTDTINLLAKNNGYGARTPWLLSVVLLLAIAAIAAYWFLVPVYYGQQKLDVMDQYLQTLKPDVKKVEALQADVEKIKEDIAAINHFKKQNDLTMNIIKDMTTILPPKTWLTRLRITDTNAEIEGYSPSATEVVLKLENTKYFQKVEFASPTFRDPRLNTERFVVKMELKNEVNKKEQKTEISHEKK